MAQAIELQLVDKLAYDAFLARAKGLTCERTADPDRPQVIFTNTEGSVVARAVLYRDAEKVGEGEHWHRPHEVGARRANQYFIAAPKRPSFLTE